MTAKELLPQIKAKGNGRLSENLAAWVKKWETRRRGFPLDVVFLHWNNIDGSHVDIVEGKTQPQQILIGHLADDGWFSGARLSCILGNGAKAEVYAFPPAFQKTLVPKWFEGYIAGGKCFIDPEHRWYGPERWQVNGKTRTCSWCGQWHEIQRKRRVSKTVTTWEPLR